MDKKTFSRVKKGDTVYLVMRAIDKVAIFKKEVTDIVHNIGFGNKLPYTWRIITKKGTWGDRYCGIDNDVTFFKVMYTEANPQYLCTNLEDAKRICIELTKEIVNKTTKELTTLQNRLNRWQTNLNELNSGNFIIK